MKKNQNTLVNKSRKSAMKKSGFRLFLMILPLLALVFAFTYLPLWGWRYAFYDYKPGWPLEKCEFTGWKWFTLLFSDQYYRDNMVRVMTNTLAMSFLGLGTSWLPMMFAVFLAEITSKKYKKLVQTATTIPNFISWVLVYAVAYALFSVGDGFFNRLLTMAGMEQINFLADTKHMWIKMWAWGTWKGLGWSAVTYIAAISGVDQQLYEAAEVDGANRWQKMWHVTLPGLIPTYFVLLVLSIGNLINNGTEQYYVFQTTLNRSTIEVLDLYVLNQGLNNGYFSFATAVGMMKSVVSVILLAFANWLSKIVRGDSVL